jgi:hypothetical protein
MGTPPPAHFSAPRRVARQIRSAAENFRKGGFIPPKDENQIRGPRKTRCVLWGAVSSQEDSKAKIFMKSRFLVKIIYI